MITLVSPQGDVTPMGVNPRVKSYPVSGLFAIGMSAYDSPIIYMPLEESQLYFNEIGRASCRERVCQSVSISVVAVSLTNNTHHNHNPNRYTRPYTTIQP